MITDDGDWDVHDEIAKWQSMICRLDASRRHCPMPVTMTVYVPPGYGYLELRMYASTSDMRNGLAVKVVRVATLPIPYPGDEDAALFVYREYLQIWEHEAREWFHLDGELYDDPHLAHFPKPR